MFKRSVSLMLLSTVLLMQWASAAQCRCHHTAHTDKPHIHLTGFSFAAPVSQEPRSGCCCHRHGSDAGDDGEDGANVPLHDGDDHDAGVVYLPTDLLHGWLTVRYSLTPDDVIVLPLLMPVAAVSVEAMQAVGTHHPPPDDVGQSCPTFLWNLTLLI